MKLKGKPRSGSDTATPRHIMPFLLPMRAKLSPLQAMKAWLLQRWQKWRTNHLVLQPPLQPARHKPFPLRPHQQRRQAVFAALDAAPTGLTRRQLIEHVRAVTGVGCSEKLITQWRQERGSEREQGRQRDGEKRRRALQLRLFLACVLWGTLVQPAPPGRLVYAQDITISPAPSDAPTISNFPSQISNPPVPRLLRIKLTLNAPHELQVKAGQQIEAGAVLSDRAQARQRLLVQQRALHAAQQHLQTQLQLTAASFRQFQSLGLQLPPTTFATERAALQRAETEAMAVHRAVEIQQQKVLVIGGQWSVAGNEIFPPNEAAPTTATRNPLPTTDHQSLITAHETAKLTQVQDKQLLALSDVELHKAKLTTAREVRAWDEQKHRVEIMRQRLSLRSQQQQVAFELARLTAQLAEVNVQLAQLTEIRAPFAGTIKRIEWEDMNNEKLTVLVYLLVGSR